MDSGATASVTRRRALGMGLVLVLVLVVHGWGLRAFHDMAAIDMENDENVLPMQVRSIVLPAMAAPPALSAAAAPRQPPPPTVDRVAARRAASKPRELTAAPSTVAPSLPPAEDAASAPQTAASPASSSVPSAIEPSSDAVASAETGGTPIDVPAYETKVPPSATWRYRLQRGLLSGQAELQWAHDETGLYRLSLQGTVAGINALDWHSAGAVGPYGVAPSRFTVQRRGRGIQAVNFDSDQGVITFSGSVNKLPWVTGVQDRLSWMVQLPAIVASNPELFHSGTTVRFMVVGVGGGAELWDFLIEGEEDLGDIGALKLVRNPTKPYGTKAQVWLDPARGYVPLRAILTQGEDGRPLQLDLLP